jgi:hypothetical protein
LDEGKAEGVSLWSPERSADACGRRPHHLRVLRALLRLELVSDPRWVVERQLARAGDVAFAGGREAVEKRQLVERWPVEAHVVVVLNPVVERLGGALHVVAANKAPVERAEIDRGLPLRAERDPLDADADRRGIDTQGLLLFEKVRPDDQRGFRTVFA